MKRIFSFMIGAVVLMLVFSMLAGCSGNSQNIANPPGNAPSGNQGSGDTATPGSGTNTGNNGTVTEPANTPDGNTSTNSSTNQGTNAGTNSGTAANDGKPKIVASNEAFRVYEPAPDAVIGKAFTVKGEASVFEAAFSYSLEDGHNVLAEGHAMADMGAPEWGKFEFTVTLTDMPTSPTGVLTIYESSAKDGSSVHELHIAYTFEKGLLKLETE
ncbi:hypothetical protein GZH47_17575 [Paenibacillus rhizovicinus]|uniref:Bacterial spore germination immunoglobulin-like domain-containing protein n=1 Tax=Paenibacillus rhizovicinus TaxID=2704463 RepID=A0A6C0P7D6_9BACL|nr:Gmad2 immunoglobulin-like domain-containing protein [Paenibacillus rhizovicinus]QHW32442.1 hypothetical protein GZH47_17575 [Paenibacillus rhizovicinus]